MIALITPTGARQKQIQLAAEWMKKQTYKGEVLWVLVDDAVPITTDFIPANFRDGWQIVRCYPRPKWEQGQNTQKRNLLVGVQEVERYDNVTSVFIIEDDDYYGPDYLEKMVLMLRGYQAAGQNKTIYFNVVTGRVRNYTNPKHCSLFQTGIHIDMLPVFKDILLGDKDTFIDVYLWEKLQKFKVHLFNGDALSIGIKGLSGRDGIGIGHKIKGVALNDLSKKSVLKSLIGADNVIKYLQ